MVIRKNSSSGSSKKRGFRGRWKHHKQADNNNTKTAPVDDEIIGENSVADDDDSFSSQEDEKLHHSPGQFRWSIDADERITDSSPMHQKIIKSKLVNRFTICAEEDLYLSNEFGLDDDDNDDNEEDMQTYIEHKYGAEQDVKNQAGIPVVSSEDTKQDEERQSQSSNRKKSKKKNSKSVATATETMSSASSKSSSRSSKKSKSASSKKPSSSKSISSSSSSSKRASKKDKKKKKKSKSTTTMYAAVTAESSSPSTSSSTTNEPPPPPPQKTRSDLDNKTRTSTKQSRKVSFLDTPTTTDRKQLRQPPPQRPSFERHSVLKDKIIASLASLGSVEQQSSNSVVDNDTTTRSSSDDARISSSSHRSSGTTSSVNDEDPVFLEAMSHDSNDNNEQQQRLSIEQNKDMLESLLDELRKYEEQLEEERNETSKERVLMQLKQEAVEQMLDTEMNQTAQLKSHISNLAEQLDHANKAMEDNELLLKIQMLEAENELLQQKTERQEETIATMAGEMAVEANHRQTSSTSFHTSHNANSSSQLYNSSSQLYNTSAPSLNFSDSLSSSRDSLALWDDDISGFPSGLMDQQGTAKAQGEILQLRSTLSHERQANAEQARELARLEQELRLFNEKDKMKELKKAVSNMEQQKNYFMKETERLKKQLALKSPTLANHSKRSTSKRSNTTTKKSKGRGGWFGIKDNVSQKCLLDLDDANMVFGSVSDIDGVVVVPENNTEESSSWIMAA
mmetsp:Transcript_24600/g.60347  ORF Transcript_24600/g.60347 Transcript_24600/m.60347 type:complete len:736 (+) Transcript_24600:109-2316(+)